LQEEHQAIKAIIQKFQSPLTKIENTEQAYKVILTVNHFCSILCDISFNNNNFPSIALQRDSDGHVFSFHQSSNLSCEVLHACKMSKVDFLTRKSSGDHQAKRRKEEKTQA
jgi:hypothetical protein